MPYTINFSDPTKLDTISVPDMPPGINTVDTSLSLVGRGYPNYGQKIAENFVHLLENFAGPIPPQNPIEGQLWYDTSDPNNKILRIMDGTATATRWPNANGIYQQGTDPRDSATQGLKIGDIWVDTASNQLKIYNSNDWTLVGPAIADPDVTGVEPTTIIDTTNTPRRAILHKVGGNVVAITAYQQFTPKAVINGFTLLKPGINLSTAAVTGEPRPIFNGTAVRAQNLLDAEGVNAFPTAEFLRKNDASQYGQVITGVVRFQTPSTRTTLTGQGYDGILINNSSSIEDPNYIQFYKGDNDAVLLNNTANGKIVFKVKGTTLGTALELADSLITVTGAATVSKTLSVANTLTVSSTATTAVTISGGVSIAKDLIANANARITGETTITGKITIGNDIIPTNNGTQYLGSLTRKFRQVYADIIGTTGSVFLGTFNGLATGLQQSTEFRIRGQITGTSVLYNGTSTTATFVTSLTADAISSQTVITTSTNLHLLVLNTATSSLGQISRDNFLSDVFPTGMIMSYGTNTNIPQGWLLCDGSEYLQIGTYSNLYNLLTVTYGTASVGYFRVPDMRKSTTATNTTTFVSYIIKT